MGRSMNSKFVMRNFKAKKYILLLGSIKLFMIMMIETIYIFQLDIWMKLVTKTRIVFYHVFLLAYIMTSHVYHTDALSFYSTFIKSSVKRSKMYNSTELIGGNSKCICTNHHLCTYGVSYNYNHIQQCHHTSGYTVTKEVTKHGSLETNRLDCVHSEYQFSSAPFCIGGSKIFFSFFFFFFSI